MKYVQNNQAYTSKLSKFFTKLAKPFAKKEAKKKSPIIESMRALDAKIKPRYVWFIDKDMSPKDRSYCRSKHGELS